MLTPLQKFPKNVRDLGKLIVAKGLKKLPKVQKIAQSGHTGVGACIDNNSYSPQKKTNQNNDDDDVLQQSHSTWVAFDHMTSEGRELTSLTPVERFSYYYLPSSSTMVSVITLFFGGNFDFPPKIGKKKFVPMRNCKTMLYFKQKFAL